MQPASRIMQTKEQIDRMQGCSSCKTLCFSVPTVSERCVIRVDQPKGCKNKSVCPVQLKRDLGAGGWAGFPQRCSGQRNSWGRCSGLSYRSVCICLALLFQLSLPQSIALMPASPSQITHTSLHSVSEHPGWAPHLPQPTSPALHPTAGQAQALPFPTPPLLTSYWDQQKEAETRGRGRPAALVLNNWEGHPMLPTDGRAGYGFRRGLCFLMQRMF